MPEDRVGGIASTEVLNRRTREVVDSQTEHDEPDNRPLYDLARGTTLGRYVVLERIGAGTMGVVYRAYDPELDRRVALKLVSVHGSIKRRAVDVGARLVREAQALARVGHPNVIQIFDIGEYDSAAPHETPAPVVFIAMELVDGLTLRQWSAAKGRTWSEVLDVFRQAGRGLWAAHQADVVHRDFKPDNVMIGNDGRVRVLDFGLARAAHPTVDSVPPELGERARPGFDEELTQHGMIIGTPVYMAAELHTGGVADPSSDQFAFSVALWEALYGTRPFGGDTHAAIACTIVQGKVRPPPSDRDVPRWLHAIALRGISLDKDQRFESMGALVEQLARDGGRGRMIVIAAAAIVTTAAVVYGVTRPAAVATPCTGADAEIAAVWTLERRAALANTFADSSFAFATDTWTSTERLLDAYAVEWASMHTEACRATRVTGEQSEALMDLRVACLDRSLRGFTALLDLLGTGDRQAIIGAVDGARARGDLSECADTVALGQRVPMPADPAVRERIEAIDAQLVAIDTRITAGAYAGLALELEALRPDVVAIDWAPLTGRTMALLAYVHLETGVAHESIASWEHAFRETLVADERRRSAMFASKLAFVNAQRAADAERARSWAQLARALLRSFDDDGRVEASITGAEASIAIAEGDYARAIELDERVREFWSGRESGEHELATAHGNLAILQRIVGRTDVAIAHAREELRINTELYGTGHPSTASSMRHLALALDDHKVYPEARALLETAIAIHRSAQGERNYDVAATLDELGRIMRHQGELELALQRHREALEVWRAVLGPDHPDVGISLTNIGYTLSAQHEYEEALELFTSARTIAERAQGKDHPSGIYLGNAGGEALLELGRPAEARQWVERGLEGRALDKVDPTLVAESWFILARALDAGDDDDRRRALVLARDARDAYAPHTDRFADQFAQIDAWLEKKR